MTELVQVRAFLGGSVVRNLPARFDPWVRKIPQRRKWLPTPVFLSENSMDIVVWGTTIHGVAKSQTQLK